MNLANSKRKNDRQTQFIFRGKSNKAGKSESRILIEALIMLFTGTNLLIFLYTLPGEFILTEFLQETWTDFSQGFIQLIDSLSKIAGALVVLILIVLGLILILGSLSRLTRLFFRLKAKNQRNS